MPPVTPTVDLVNHAAKQDFAWWFVALLVIGLIAGYFLAQYFIRQVTALQTEIKSVRTDFEGHLKTQNAEVVAALTKSTEVIEQNSKVLADLAASARSRAHAIHSAPPLL